MLINVGLLLALSGMQGCAADADVPSDDTSVPSDDEQADRLAPTDSSFGGRPAHLMAPGMLSKLLPDSANTLRNARVFDLGEVEQVAPTGPMQLPVPEGEDFTKGTLAEPPSGRGSIIVGHEGREYLVEFDLDQAASDRVQARLTAENEALARLISAEEEGFTDTRIEKGVVGSETRVRQGLADGISKTSWMGAVGLLSSDTNFATQVCTGTLIRSDIVLTAAHCVAYWNPTAKKLMINQLAFSPRADNTTNDKYPWGNWRWRSSYYYPPAYTINNCHKSYTGACQELDWALVRVTKPASAAAHNLKFTLASRSQAQMSDLKNRGYPICSSAFPPKSCLSRTLYGDNAICAVSTAVGNDGGFATRVAHSCDTTNGNSGGPLYQYVNGVPTLVGVHVSDAGVVAALDQNNWMRHVTPNMITLINNTIPTLQ